MKLRELHEKALLAALLFFRFSDVTDDVNKFFWISARVHFLPRGELFLFTWFSSSP